MEKAAAAASARILSLRVRAFKSFGDEVEVFSFCKGFNLIVGANGSGKSNILDAICFVLCSKPSHIRVGHLTELQSTETKEPCEVSLDLQLYDSSTGEEMQKLTLSVKLLPNGVRQYKIDGKLKSMKEVKDLLKELRLQLDETSAVVHQSNVTELADKNSPLKLASIISAASGAGRWNEEVDMARKELKSTRVGLDEIQENINLLENSIAKDNACLEKLLRAEQLEKDIGYISRQIFSFQQLKHIKIKDGIWKIEERMKLLEDMIQEKKNIISDKRASMKKCELRSRASYSPMNTRKMEIIDTITIREEEILTLETKIKQINLQEYNLDIMSSTVESLEMEILILQKRLKVKRESMRKLELRFMNVNRRHDSQSNLNKYKDELTTNIKESERKLQTLNTEEEHVKESLQAAQKEISQWEIRLEEKKEEKLLIQKFKESNDLNATKKLEMNYHKIVEIRKSSDEILTQIHIMTAQLGNLSLEESALPAWPLHSCFRFKHEIEGICKYLDALNVIAGSIKKVCITGTTDGAARLLDIWDHQSSDSGKFCRIWPLDRLTFEEVIRIPKSVEKSLPDGSIIRPTDLLKYDHQFTKAISRAFGKYVIALSDDVGIHLATKNICNVTLDGKVNRPGSVSGGWRGNSDNGYLHIKFRKEKADKELTSLYSEELEVDKEIQILEQVALSVERFKLKEETVLQDILLLESQIASLRIEASRHEAQLQQLQKCILFAQSDIEMNTRHLDAFMEDTSSVTWDAKNALEELKEEESNIRETLAKLQSRKEEINADKTNIRQRLHQKEKEEMECLVQSYRTELSQLKGELEQINESLKQMVQEEKCQREMGFADKEAIEDAQKAIDEFCEDMDRLEEELKHARKEEEKIGNELKVSSLSLEGEVIDVEIIDDGYGLSCAKSNLQKLNAELDQLRSEHEGISLEEQVAIKERTESLKMFKDRKASIIDSIDILMVGIEKTREKVQEANEVVFQTVRQAFTECCRYLMPNKIVDLIKLGQYVQDGVKFRFSNLSEWSPNRTQDWKMNLDELSGGQRTLIGLAFLLMVAASGQSPVYLMDEIDAALDEENQNRVAKLIHEDMVAKGIQVISVSHHIAFQRHCGKLIQVTRSGGTTRQQKSHESL